MHFGVVAKALYNTAVQSTADSYVVADVFLCNLTRFGVVSKALYNTTVQSAADGVVVTDVVNRVTGYTAQGSEEGPVATDTAVITVF